MCMVLLFGMAQWPLSRDWIEPRITQVLEQNTDYRLERFGSASFRALPWPTLRITDLAVKKANGANESLSVMRLSARLNLASWLGDAPRLVSLALLAPRLRLTSPETFDANGSSSDMQVITTAAEDFWRRKDRAGSAPLAITRLRIKNGQVTLDDQPVIDALDWELDRTNASNARLKAQAIYRQTPVSLDLTISPGASQRDRQIDWTFGTQILQATFSGLLFGPRSLDAKGRFDLTITDGPLLARRLALHPDHGALVDGVTLAGQTRVNWPVIQISSARLQRGSERLDGSVDLTVDRLNPRLSATLDAEQLDVTPLITPWFAALNAQGNTWSTQPIWTDWMRAVSVDVRLSAAQLNLGAVVLEKAALSAQIGAGRFEAVLNEARIKTGLVKGRIGLNTASDGVEFRASGSADQIDIAAFMEAFGINRLRGLTQAQFTLEATGRTMEQLMASSSGRSHMTIKNGSINGIDFERGIGRAELANAGGFPLVGRTRFQSLSIQTRIAQGTATLAESAIATPLMRIPMEGSIGLFTRNFDLTGKLLPIGGSDRTGDIMLRIEGPWSNPVVTTQPSRLINRRS